MFTPFILHFNDINSTKYYILLSSDDLKYLRKSIRKNALITKPIPNKGQLLAESSQRRKTCGLPNQSRLNYAR